MQPHNVNQAAHVMLIIQTGVDISAGLLSGHLVVAYANDDGKLDIATTDWLWRCKVPIYY